MSTVAPGRESSVRPVALILLFGLQAFCVASLVGDVAAEFFVAPDPGGLDVDDRFEFAVVAALALSLAFTGSEVWRLVSRQRRVENQLKAASGAFQEVLDAHFDQWALTSAERDVALLALKGLTIADIAALRSSREGTVKAQCSAIYRKAGVSGRPQLISLFIEELMADPLKTPAPSAQGAD